MFNNLLLVKIRFGWTYLYIFVFCRLCNGHSRCGLTGLLYIVLRIICGIIKSINLSRFSVRVDIKSRHDSLWALPASSKASEGVPSNTHLRSENQIKNNKRSPIFICARVVSKTGICTSIVKGKSKSGYKSSLFQIFFRAGWKDLNQYWILDTIQHTLTECPFAWVMWNHFQSPPGCRCVIKLVPFVVYLMIKFTDISSFILTSACKPERSESEVVNWLIDARLPSALSLIFLVVTLVLFFPSSSPTKNSTSLDVMFRSMLSSAYHTLVKHKWRLTKIRYFFPVWSFVVTIVA